MEANEDAKEVILRMSRLSKFQYDESSFDAKQGERNLIDNLAYISNMLGSALRRTSVSREYVSVILQLCPVPAFLINANGVVEEASEAAARLLGHRRVDLISRSISKFLPAEFNIQSARGEQLMVRLLTNNGRRVPVHFVAAELPHDWGRNDMIVVAQPIDAQSIYAFMKLAHLFNPDPGLQQRLNKTLPLMSPRPVVNPWRMELKITNQDLEILRLLVEEMSNEEIGSELGIHRSTAARRVDSLKKRFGVKKNSKLVFLCCEYRLLGELAY